MEIHPLDIDAIQLGSMYRIVWGDNLVERCLCERLFEKNIEDGSIIYVFVCADNGNRYLIGVSRTEGGFFPAMVEGDDIEFNFASPLKLMSDNEYEQGMLKGGRKGRRRR